MSELSDKEIIIIMTTKCADLEAKLEEAREGVKTYKYDLEALVSILHDCVWRMSQEECYATLKQLDYYYRQKYRRKEKGE
jgi:hypothetical protein